MIPSGFKDYFLSRKSVVQQDKLKTLLSLSTSGEQLYQLKFYLTYQFYSLLL
jgi:hypothetical protein